jgi:hypothetical protein
MHSTLIELDLSMSDFLSMVVAVVLVISSDIIQIFYSQYEHPNYVSIKRTWFDDGAMARYSLLSLQVIRSNSGGEAT